MRWSASWRADRGAAMRRGARRRPPHRGVGGVAGFARVVFAGAAAALAAGCSTPYCDGVVVGERTTFRGVADFLGANPLDVVLVHGMCSQPDGWADAAIDALGTAVGAHVRPAAPAPQPKTFDAVPTVIVHDRPGGRIAGYEVHYRGVEWGAMTQPLKERLAYDATAAEANDCRVGDAAACRPVRAELNGRLKDRLLNDCLADALAYQGRRDAIRQSMVDALTAIAGADGPGDAATARPLVVVSSSLGSKIVFDALRAMLDAPAGSTEKSAVDRLATRLAAVYMQANQWPILALADPPDVARGGGAGVAAAASPPVDAAVSVLRDLAAARVRVAAVDRPTLAALQVVAFTDPNDLLAYRLRGSAIDALAGPLTVADVLVSNRSTWFGWVENPLGAHDYADTPAVARFIACGHPASARCR